MRPFSGKGVTPRNVSRRGVGAGAGAPELETDAVAVEEPLEIRIAGEPVAITMRTPGADAELALGFLFSEGIIHSIDEVGTVTHCGRPGEEGYGNVIDVIPVAGVTPQMDRVLATRRGTITTAACGVCGRRSIDDLIALCGRLPESPALPLAQVHRALAQLRVAQSIFTATGGTHAALAVSAAGEGLAVHEDIGRHNAVDKVVGSLLKQRASAALLGVSGRASFEIVQKAAVAGLPIIASVSAASSLAIDLAERVGIALLAFVRDGKVSIYTHAERLECVKPSQSSG